MPADILNKTVCRGKLWVASHTWASAIDAHAELCASGSCRFIVNEDGIWMEGDASRSRAYKTKLPKGAEEHARKAISREGLVPSTRDAEYMVAKAYA